MISEVGLGNLEYLNDFSSRCSEWLFSPVKYCDHFSNHSGKEYITFWRYVGLTFVMVAIIAGCASAPINTESGNDVSDAVDHAVDDEPVANMDYLGGADPKSIRRCREVAPTGTYIKRIVCGPPRDDRALISIISSPPNSN